MAKGNRSTPSKSARLNATVDLGLEIQRLAAITKAMIDQLQEDLLGTGVHTKDFGKRVQECAGVLDTLSLTYARYLKAEEDWNTKLSPEEKLEAMRTFLLAYFAEQPQNAIRWVEATARALNQARSTAQESVRRVSTTYPDLDPKTDNEVEKYGDWD